MTNRKSVIITFEGVLEMPACSPTIVEVKGPNPIEFENGYVAFEDLPDSQRHLPGQKPDWGPLTEEDFSDGGDDGVDLELFAFALFIDDDDRIVFDFG